jgi:hypothetical protein
MSELFAEGDLVEATDGERRVIERVQMNAAYKCLWIPLLGFIGNIAADGTLAGFTLTLVEKASPPLPTEPGIYVSWVNPPSPKIVHKSSIGFWVDAGDNNYLEDSDVSALMPLTRLEPVAETAKKVLDRVLEEYKTLPLRFVADVLPIVAKEFGVTS